MKRIMIFLLLPGLSVCLPAEAARIRNRKVREAPRSCRLMSEDSFLSRRDKKVLGTLRHSLIIENSEDARTVTLIKDKGEKICEWKLEQWQSIEADNKLPEVTDFKFHVDEYKEILYPYVRKADGSYFLLKVPFKTCELSDQSTKAKLELPKCEPPKKKSRKKRGSSKKKKTIKKTSGQKSGR